MRTVPCVSPSVKEAQRGALGRLAGDNHYWLAAPHVDREQFGLVAGGRLSCFGRPGRPWDGSRSSMGAVGIAIECQLDARDRSIDVAPHGSDVVGLALGVGLVSRNAVGELAHGTANRRNCLGDAARHVVDQRRSADGQGQVVGSERCGRGACRGPGGIAGAGACTGSGSGRAASAGPGTATTAAGWASTARGFGGRIRSRSTKRKKRATTANASAAATRRRLKLVARAGVGGDGEVSAAGAPEGAAGARLSSCMREPQRLVTGRTAVSASAFVVSGAETTAASSR